jgi:hypothetical protein
VAASRLYTSFQVHVRIAIYNQCRTSFTKFEKISQVCAAIVRGSI